MEGRELCLCVLSGDRDKEGADVPEVWKHLLVLFSLALGRKYSKSFAFFLLQPSYNGRLQVVDGSGLTESPRGIVGPQSCNTFFRL